MIEAFFNLIKFYRINYLPNHNIENIIKHHNRIFKKKKQNNHGKKKVLFEFSTYKSLIISYSYFSKLANKGQMLY